jgi:hypothetical protein
MSELKQGEITSAIRFFLRTTISPAGYRVNKWKVLSIWYNGSWIHSINGNKADHHAHFAPAQLEFPIKRFLGMTVKAMKPRDYDEPAEGLGDRLVLLGLGESCSLQGAGP